MTTKRKAESSVGPLQDQDPDYETIAVMTASKRQRLFEKDAKDITVKKIEEVIKRQFTVEMRRKEKEVELIDERVHQVRAMLDKLRACIMANYYGNIGLSQSSVRVEKTRSVKSNLNHPAVQRALTNKLKAAADSAPPDLQTAVPTTTEADTLPSAVTIPTLEPASTPSSWQWSGQQSERSSPDSEQLSRVDPLEIEEATEGGGAKGPRNTGPDTFGVGPPLLHPKPLVSQVESDEGSRFHVKKRIIVGNVSKYIPPENREDSDPSTHKWMVYVRGPPEEPRIDHFVKRIWFFLHPSYRPNDLVEVKEPPFHLTRRGWGEFPIRIQLHFLDPRNKKVDIIHPLKLDRTYTGLQTLGAETIVDVELDRYLFDDHGQPLSRPMTPTITKVNYQEGIKPGSPGTSWDEARWKCVSESPRIKEPSGRIVGSDSVLEEIRWSKGSLKSEELSSQAVVVEQDSGTSQKIEQDQNLSPNEVPPSGPVESFSAIIGSSGIQPSSQVNLLGGASGGQIAVQQRQGGQFVRVMPPLGPITKGAAVTPSLGGVLQAVTLPSASPSRVITPTDEKSSSVFGSPSSSQSSSANVSPTQPVGINVADAALAGKGTLDVRIQEGKVVQEMASPTQDVTKTKTELTNVTVVQEGIPPLTQPALVKSTPVLQTTAPSRVQNVPSGTVSSSLQKISQVVGGSVLGGSGSQVGGLVVQPTTVQQSKPVMMSTVPTSITGGSVPAVKRNPSSGSITVIPMRSPTESQKQPTSAAGIPPAPPGTQYYITAKSADPNLQGKVILIPQQVFQQASSQQALAGSKQGAGKASSSVGKAGTSKVPATSKASFLSPSNVLILPAGSIVPPLPPGSIVQIQQVPSPVRSVTVSSQPKSHPTSAPAKMITALAKNPSAKLTGISSGGVIQIQRTPGTTAAKLSGVHGVSSQTTGISILPEQKAQLSKAPSSGVVFVQRASSAGKIGSGQTLARLPLVQGGLALQQKITLATQLPPVAVTLPQASLSLKPGSSVNIIQNPTTKSFQHGQTLVLHAQPSPVLKIPGKPLQTVTAIRQPSVSGQPSKFIIQGQGSRVLTPGQLQIRLPLGTSGAAAMPIATAANPKTVIAQLPGHTETVLTALAAVAGKQEDGSSQSTSVEESSQEAIIVDDEIKQPTKEKESVLQKSLTAVLSPELLELCPVQAEVPKTEVLHPNLSQQLPKLIIKQEPVTSPQKDFLLAPAAQSIVYPASDTSFKMEIEEKDESVLSLMRDLTRSCQEGPVSVYGLRTMEELITAVVKKTLLINKNRAQTEQPFSATSLQHYHSWSGAKRRAAEWHRAVSVKRIANEAREKSEPLRFERMWTTKKVMVWCRQYGYTPQEPDIHEAKTSWCNICGDLSKKGTTVQTEDEQHNCRSDWLSTAGLLKPVTYTVSEEIVTELQTQQAAIDQACSDSEEDIDIIGVWDLRQQTRIKREPSGVDKGIRSYLPPSDGAKLVQEEAQQIGVHFKPSQLARDTFAPVAEEVMFSAVSQFLSSLLRESFSKAYNKRTDNRLPREILPTHILRAIKDNELFDFLSNRHLGVLTMATEDNQDTSS